MVHSQKIIQISLRSLSWALTSPCSSQYYLIPETSFQSIVHICNCVTSEDKQWKDRDMKKQQCVWLYSLWPQLHQITMKGPLSKSIGSWRFPLPLQLLPLHNCLGIKMWGKKEIKGKNGEFLPPSLFKPELEHSPGVPRCSLPDFKLYQVQVGEFERWIRVGNSSLVCWFLKIWYSPICLKLFTFQNSQIAGPCTLSRSYDCVQWETKSGRHLLVLTRTVLKN